MVKTAQTQEDKERVMLKSHSALESLKMLQIVRRYNLEDNEIMMLNDSKKGISGGAYCSIITNRYFALIDECERANIEVYLLVFVEDNLYTIPKYGTDELAMLQTYKAAEKELEERELKIKVYDTFIEAYLDIIG